MENKYFTQALSDFTFDMASGGEICHLCDLGYSVREISEKLLFPTPISKIQQTVWKHLREEGVILLSDPGEIHETEKISYVKEYQSTGKASFRRIVEKREKPSGDYIPCDFGKQMYQDKEQFEKKLEALNAKDRDYILGLPWPLERVYHVADERMRRIQRQLGESMRIH